MKNKRKKNFWKTSIVKESASVKDVIANLDSSGLQIALVVKNNNELVGSVTDGDIRRSLLAENSLTNLVTSIMTENPLVIHSGLPNEEIRSLMKANKIKQLPEVNNKGELVDLHTWDNVSKTSKRPNTFVIMAGGFGKRMEEITDTCPKPMVELGGKPMLEHIIERAKQEGFRNFIISVYYLADQIKEYFGNGTKWNVHINYIQEENPLGTAGALSLINIDLQFPFIVTNGDVISDIKYGELIDFHNLHMPEATMAVRKHELVNPYGVVNTDGINITGLEEKPKYISYVNAGIYALQPGILNYLEKAAYCDMPTLFDNLKSNLKKTIVYPIHEIWFDVGNKTDIKTANSFINKDQQK